MVEFERSFEFPVITIGRQAAPLRNAPVNGEVIAVFESTFYVAAGEHTLCVGGKDVNLGPLNVVTSAPSRTNWPASGIRRRAKVTVSAAQIRVADRFVFSLAQSSIWSPSPIDPIIDPNAVRCGLDAFRQLARHRAPEDGLGQFLVHDFAPQSDNPVCYAAQPAIKAARSWLSATFTNRGRHPTPDTPWVERLAGLGPGLTPSGDDFIGGLLIALHALGRPDIAQSLWHRVRRHVQTAGNVISHAHLAAAAEGVGAEAVHNALSEILHGNVEKIHVEINTIEGIGHTSGWDAMTGIVTALECWHDASMPRTTHGSLLAERTHT